MLPQINPTTTNAWKKLEEYYFGFEGTHIKELFEKDSERFQKYSLKFEDILFDFSKNIVDDTVRELLLELAKECGLKDAIKSFDEIIRNHTQSDKIAGALLKKGYSLLELGKRDEGILVLKKVINDYPLSEEAGLAEQKLKEIGVSGKEN